MAINDYLEKINNEGFIKSYLGNVGDVSENDLREFLKLIADDGDYMVIEGGAQIYDCWTIWHDARESLTKDLKTALEGILDMSSNYTVYGSSSHEYNVFDKLAEIGELTPEWGNAMAIKAALEQLLVYSKDEFVTVGDYKFHIREKIKDISSGVYGDDDGSNELIATLTQLASVTGDGFVLSSPAGTFNVREKLIEFKTSNLDEMISIESMCM